MKRTTRTFTFLLLVYSMFWAQNTTAEWKRLGGNPCPWIGRGVDMAIGEISSLR